MLTQEELVTDDLGDPNISTLLKMSKSALDRNLPQDGPYPDSHPYLI